MLQGFYHPLLGPLDCVMAQCGTSDCAMSPSWQVVLKSFHVLLDQKALQRTMQVLCSCRTLSSIATHRLKHLCDDCGGQVLAEVRHPAVLSVTAVVEDEQQNLIWLEMPFLDGGTHATLHNAIDGLLSLTMLSLCF